MVSPRLWNNYAKSAPPNPKHLRNFKQTKSVFKRLVKLFKGYIHSATLTKWVNHQPSQIQHEAGHSHHMSRRPSWVGPKSGLAQHPDSRSGTLHSLKCGPFKQLSPFSLMGIIK